MRHAEDDGVIFGVVGELSAGDYDAGVSLCRVESEQTRVASAQDHAEMWIADSEDNHYVEFTLRDAAAAVKDFRDAGKPALPHCLRMESRTSTVAVLYSSLVTGSTPTEGSRADPKCLVGGSAESGVPRNDVVRAFGRTRVTARYGADFHPVSQCSRPIKCERGQIR